jgi:hypothetical protein
MLIFASYFLSFSGNGDSERRRVNDHGMIHAGACDRRVTDESKTFVRRHGRLRASVDHHGSIHLCAHGRTVILCAAFEPRRTPASDHHTYGSSFPHFQAVYVGFPCAWQLKRRWESPPARHAKPDDEPSARRRPNTDNLNRHHRTLFPAPKILTAQQLLDIEMNKCQSP